MPGTGTYTVEELLALRNSSSPKVEDCLSRLARQEPDLKDILRAKQGDILRTINIGSTTNPSAKRTARGRVDTPASHVIKEQLSLSQHQVQQHQQNVPQPTRAWNTTEASSADPVPKPADLAPQEVEGFKKFYKAVVSPSHVRVTAGGRIVPNNRAPSSPTPKATRPNHGIPGTAAFANTNPPPFAVNGTLPPVRPHTNAYSTLPTPASQVLPQLPTQIGYLPTDHGWVQIPIAFAPPGCAVMRSPYSHGSGNLFAPGQNIEKDKGSAADHPNVSTLHGPVVLPGPYINQVPSQPSLALPQVGGSMPSRRNQSPNSVARGSGYHPSMMMGTALSSALNLTMSNPVQPHVPPASSIKASDITKCHIKRMKEVIKYNEDQIHLNKHQIDEKALREQNEQVKALIETFRKTYEMQVKVEDNFLAKDRRDSSSGRTDRSDDMPNSHALGRDSIHTESTTLSDVNDGAIRDVPDHAGYASQTSGSLSSGFPLGQVQDLCSSTMSGAEGSFQTAQVPVHSIDPIKRPSWTSLPRAAAAAAPFQPRRDLAPADRGYCAGQLNPGAGQEQRFGDHTARTFATARSEKHVSFRAEGGNASQGLGTPYLVGQLPPGRNPRDGFVYNRELTDEEKQSRYLYWGRASKAARRGLPKFDGQHFYPPSPPKERESVQGLFPTPEAGPSVPIPQGQNEGDPFRGLSSLGKEEQHSVNNQISAPGTSAPTSTLTGQVSTRTSSEFLRNIIKKGPAGGNALPGAVSSMTAQGVLPQYSGHAAASLGPAIAEPLSSQAAEPKLEVDSSDLPEAELRLRELAIQDLRKAGLSPLE